MAALDILRLLLSVLAIFKSRQSLIAAFFRHLVPHGRDVAGGYGIVIVPSGGEGLVGPRKLATASIVDIHRGCSSANIL